MRAAMSAYRHSPCTIGNDMSETDASFPKLCVGLELQYFLHVFNTGHIVIDAIHECFHIDGYACKNKLECLHVNCGTLSCIRHG